LAESIHFRPVAVSVQNIQFERTDCEVKSQYEFGREKYWQWTKENGTREEK
jgi:hypothetical protein